jgi:hypothetical protein
MNAAIPERRPATEISGVIERVTDFASRPLSIGNYFEHGLNFGRRSRMKHKSPFLLRLVLPAICFSAISAAQALKPVQLPLPQTTEGRPLMEVLKDRKSTREFGSGTLSHQTLSKPALGGFRHQPTRWASYCAFRHELAGSKHLRGNSGRRVRLRCQGDRICR